MAHESKRRRAEAGGCVLFEHPNGLWIQDEDGDTAIVPRDALKRLLPALQHFAETGELPEPKP